MSIPVFYLLYFSIFIFTMALLSHTPKKKEDKKDEVIDDSNDS